MVKVIPSNRINPLASNQDVEEKERLHVAVMRDQPGEVERLLTIELKGNHTRYSNTESGWKYPYQRAIDKGNREILRLFLDYYKILKIRIEEEKTGYGRGKFLAFSVPVLLVAIMSFFYAARSQHSKDEVINPYVFCFLPFVVLLLSMKGLIERKLSQKSLDQTDEKLSKVYSKICEIDILKNEVEKVQEFLKYYSKCIGIKVKGDGEYLYQCAIERGNREILKLFSHHYKERNAKIERIKRKSEGKVGLFDNAKKVYKAVSVCIGTFLSLYGGINYFVTKSQTDILEESLSGFIFPTFYKNYQYLLDVQKRGLNIDNQIIKILLDYEQRKYENLTDKAKHEYINGTGVIEALMNQVKNRTLELSKEIKWAEDEVREINVYNGSIGKAYHHHMKILEGFTDYTQQTLAILSIASGIMLLVNCVLEGLHSYYSGKYTSECKLLDQINEKLNKINDKINEIEVPDRVSRNLISEKIIIEDLIRKNVKEMLPRMANDNDEDLDAKIQEIETNVKLEDPSVSRRCSSERRLF